MTRGVNEMPVSDITKELLSRAAKGDSAAQTRLIEENIGLVRAFARRFSGRGIEYDDLFQAGCMGLVKAVAGFDIGRGVRFSTYAVPVIMGEMRRLFRDDGPVKVSRSLKEASMRAQKARRELGTALGREPTIGELSARLGVTAEEAAQALGAGMLPVSLTSGDEGGGAENDIPVDSGEEEVVDKIALKDALRRLEPQERRLIMLRYFGGKTQTETAQSLKMTQVQVSRCEKKILGKLRNGLEG
jgi:RNA polymerase sporulation-specific sigma factor